MAAETSSASNSLPDVAAVVAAAAVAASAVAAAAVVGSAVGTVDYD